MHPSCLQVMADEGVIAPVSDYVQVYLNGKFYGLFGMIEKVGGVSSRLAAVQNRTAVLSLSMIQLLVSSAPV